MPMEEQFCRRNWDGHFLMLNKSIKGRALQCILHLQQPAMNGASIMNNVHVSGSPRPTTTLRCVATDTTGQKSRLVTGVTMKVSFVILYRFKT